MSKKSITAENGKEGTGSAYPAFALEDAIRFGEAVRDLGGSRSSVKKSVLAQHFKVAQSTPSFFQRLSAAKSFGIIEGWGGYTLTAEARMYFYPTNEDDKRVAGLSFLRRPPAFAVLLDRFDGEKLPPSDLLGNILHHEAGIPATWKDRVASIFIRSANFLGIIDADGFLRYDANMHNIMPTAGAVRGSNESEPGQEASAEVRRTKRQLEAPTAGHTAWTFPFEGGFLRLETPEGMSKELWDKLNAYVQILKPVESSAK